MHKRRNSELVPIAEAYTQRGEWRDFVSKLKTPFVKRYPYSTSIGMARDALVHLLQLEPVGGTDTDVFMEFGDLPGSTLEEVRQEALDHSIKLLRDQIANRHTFFLDAEAMAPTPFAVLLEDVLAARTKELEDLKPGTSRIPVLGTYYGFLILISEGASYRGLPPQAATSYYAYRKHAPTQTWLNAEIKEEAAAAIRNLTGELASAVDMDRTYRTLGSSDIFSKRCTPSTTSILENAVRLSLYKSQRSGAATNLGGTGDSRALPFLHSRLPIEQNNGVLRSIAHALGYMAHASSASVLYERISNETSNSKQTMALVAPLGSIDAPETIEVLKALLNHKAYVVRTTAINCLERLRPPDFTEIIVPCLGEKTTSVVAAAMISLSNFGEDGARALRENITLVLSRVGKDKSIQRAFRQVLLAKGIGSLEEVHDYFAGKLKSEITAVKKSERSRARNPRRGPAYYRGELKFTIGVVMNYLKPPFSESLSTELENARGILPSQ